MAVTYSSQRDGDYEETIFCYGMTGGNLNVRNIRGHELTIPPSAIKKVLAKPTPVIAYPIGSNVEFEYDYHQIDGAYTTFGKIVSYRTFYNDVTYSILNFKDNSVKEYHSRDVERHANLKTPKYAKDQCVSIVTVYAEHQLDDDIRENGIITAVTAGFDKVTYTVKLDSGATKVVEEYSIGKALPPPKTPQQQRDDLKSLSNKVDEVDDEDDDEEEFSIDYQFRHRRAQQKGENLKSLREEEIRLMQQLEAVRARMQRL